MSLSLQVGELAMVFLLRDRCEAVGFSHLELEWWEKQTKPPNNVTQG